MKYTGIIAEYNPFHNGHLRQLRFLRQQGVELIAVAMSGNFVQRGAPAWADKYLRAKMALEQGADLVFELPVLYALSSAQGFASGGISLLDSLMLDSFCFGCESDNLEALQETARLLAQEPPAFREILQKKLQEGLSFPAARQYALTRLLPDLSSGPGINAAAYASILSEPNNILAVEYLRAALCQGSGMIPIPIQRNDAGYNSLTLSDQTPSSASAIRAACETSGGIDSCRSTLPAQIYSLLQENQERCGIVPDDFSEMIYYALRHAVQTNTLTEYGEISPELSNRITHFLPEYTTLSAFISLLKTKNITYSHISRNLFQLLLGIRSSLAGQTHQPVPYLRLLGIRQESSAYLRKITNIPVITKTADGIQQLKQSGTSFSTDCFKLDLLAADLYRHILFHKTGCLLPDEYRAGIIKVSRLP